MESNQDPSEMVPWQHPASVHHKKAKARFGGVDGFKQKTDIGLVYKQQKEKVPSHPEVSPEEEQEYW